MTYLSPRDGDGHGTHTSSTAAGNANIDPSIDGNDLGVEDDLGDRATGLGRDVQGLLEQQRRKRRRVRRCGPHCRDRPGRRRRRRRHQLFDRFGQLGHPDRRRDQLPLRRRRRRVRVGFGGQRRTGRKHRRFSGFGAVGDDGRRESAGPILPRDRQSDRDGRCDAAVTGASVTNAVGPAALVDAEDVAASGVDPADAELCLAGSLDPAKVSGKIVLCLRGVNARVAEVADRRRRGRRRDDPLQPVRCAGIEHRQPLRPDHPCQPHQRHGRQGFHRRQQR